MVLLFLLFSLSRGLMPPSYPYHCREWSRRCGSAIDMELYKAAPVSEYCVLDAPLGSVMRPKCLLSPYSNRESGKMERVSEMCRNEVLPFSCLWKPKLYVCIKTSGVMNGGTVRGPIFSVRFANGQVTGWQSSSHLRDFYAGVETCVEVDQVSMVGEMTLTDHVDAVALRILSSNGWCFEKLSLVSRLTECEDPASCFQGYEERLDWDIERMSDECGPCGKGSFSTHEGKKCFWFDERQECHSPQMVLFNDKRMHGEAAVPQGAECTFFYNSQFAIGETIFENVFHLYLPEYKKRPPRVPYVKHSCSQTSDCEKINMNAICDASTTSVIPYPYPRCRTQVAWKGVCSEESDNVCRSGYECREGLCEPMTLRGGRALMN